jgi:hypothetical protein
LAGDLGDVGDLVYIFTVVVRSLPWVRTCTTFDGDNFGALFAVAIAGEGACMEGAD